MKNSDLKIIARGINASFGKRIYLSTIFLELMKIAFLLSTAFCAYTLFAYHNVKSNSSIDILYYALFSLGVIFSVCLFIITKYTLRRIFMESTIKNEEIKIFKALSIGFQLKIIYLHFFKFFINQLYLIFYLLPSALVVMITLYYLPKGIDALIFFACSILFLAFFVLGILFYFAARQKLYLLDEFATLNASLSAVEVIKALIKTDAKSCFKLLSFKLSFAFWKILCVFIFPAFFVIPYFRRSISLYAKQTLKIKSPKPVKEKPVIILKVLPTKQSP